MDIKALQKHNYYNFALALLRKEKYHCATLAQ
jgi:hypothetical protein